MGEEHKLKVICYSIIGSTGEIQPFGNPIEIPKFARGGIVDDGISNIGESEKLTIGILPRTITRKRFVKLLMSMKYQKNEANMIHNEYMKINKTRTEIGMLIFLQTYNTKNEYTIKLKI